MLLIHLYKHHRGDAKVRALRCIHTPSRPNAIRICASRATRRIMKRHATRIDTHIWREKRFRCCSQRANRNKDQKIKVNEIDENERERMRKTEIAIYRRCLIVLTPPIQYVCIECNHALTTYIMSLWMWCVDLDICLTGNMWKLLNYIQFAFAVSFNKLNWITSRLGDVFGRVYGWKMISISVANGNSNTNQFLRFLAFCLSTTQSTEANLYFCICSFVHVKVACMGSETRHNSSCHFLWRKRTPLFFLHLIWTNRSDSYRFQL